MAKLNLAPDLEVVQDAQEMSRGEGKVFTIDISPWTSETPSSATLTVFVEDTGEEVTSSFVPSGSASISSTIITLPEIVIPALALIRNYIAFVSFEASGYSPGKAWFRIPVFD